SRAIIRKRGAVGASQFCNLGNSGDSGNSFLSNVLVKVLQVVSHSHQELVSVGAIHNAVVISQYQPDDVAHSNRIVAIFVCDNHRFLEDAAHAQNGDLRLQDDGRPELRTINSRVGNSDGSTLHFIGQQFLVARTLAQITDGAMQADKAQVLRAFHHRHNESPFQRDGNADVDVLVVLNAVTGN